MQWPFAQWGADVVFSGDEHSYERILRDGIVYFVNGLGGQWPYSLGTPIAGSVAQYNATNGAQRVIATNTSMTFEFYSIANGGTLIDSYTITAPHNTATPSPQPMSNGWQSPTNQVAVKNAGDNNGYEGNPAYAFANDGLAAMDVDSGTNPTFTCTDAGTDKHKFYNYALSIPSGATVQGIQVRLDANADSTVGNPKICVSLSGNGGTSWTAWKSSPTLTNAEASYFLGGTSDIWEHIWTPEELSSTNFQVRVANVTSDNSTDFSLDWIAVHAMYSVGPTNTPTFTESPTLTPTASQTGTPTATPSSSVTASQTETSTATPSPSMIHSQTDTPTTTLSPSITASPTVTPSASTIPTETDTFTPTPTATETPTSTSTLTSPPISTFTATGTPTATQTPTNTLEMLQLKSSAAQDGWVLESSETSNQGGSTNPTAATLILGDNATKQQYRSILHFDTSALPDNAEITRVILKLKRQSVTGTNPFTTHGKITIDVRKGTFSNASALQITDFQAAARKTGVGLIANHPTSDGWYSTSLLTAAYSYINRTGITQFRLRFQTDDDNDPAADFLRFYSGNATAANQPILVIEYSVP